jgi:hypothetical protein
MKLGRRARCLDMLAPRDEPFSRRVSIAAEIQEQLESRMFWKELTRKKSIEQLQSDADRRSQLRRVLGLWQLTSIGLGGLIGVGIFVLTGIVAATQAGPAVSLSFVIAGVASGAAALCYAEFSGMIPVAGSAYTYAYAVLGEFVAWVIGWDLLLEYALVVSVVSIGWSGYLQALLAQLGVTIPVWATGAPGAGRIVDLPAMLASMSVAGILTLRIEWGARFNAAMVIIKIHMCARPIGAPSCHMDLPAWSREPPSFSLRCLDMTRSQQRPKRRKIRNGNCRLQSCFRLLFRSRCISQCRSCLRASRLMRL